MKLTVLGSGTVDPRGDRAGSGYYVEADSQSWVVDLGSGSLRNGVKFGLNMAGLNTVFLTHFHPDHTADIVSLLFARKYAPVAWQQRQPLRLWGPPGITEFLDGLYSVWPSIKPGDDQTAVMTETLPLMGGQRTFAPGLEVIWTAVDHADMSALAYRFESKEQSIAFSGDTKLCKGVVDIAEGATLFVCECACFGRGCEPLACRDVHLGWEDVAEICEEAKPSRLVLTHLYQLVLDTPPGVLEPLSERLTIPVSLASDGAEFLVGSA